MGTNKVADNAQFSIRSIELGPMQNLLYLITDKATQKAAVVDPAWDSQAIFKMAKAENAIITDILLSHTRHDHINAIHDVIKPTDAALHVLKAETKIWHDKQLNPLLHYGDDLLQLGKTEIKILHTPGHSIGSACYQIGDYLITGDTLFVWGCGHCKLPSADPETLFHTLKKIAQLPSHLITLPGHHYADRQSATIKEQCDGNPFMHFDKKEDFIHYRTVEHDKIRLYPYTAEKKI